MRTSVISFTLFFACLAVAHGSRGQTVSNDLCGTCKAAVHVLKDLICDPEIEGLAVDWVIDNVCPATGSTQSCADIVNGVAPALFDWLRLGADDEQMCSEVGVCGKPSLFTATAKQHRLRSSDRNDMTCPLCMYVVSKVKEQLSDPVTRESIHEKTTAACGVLPAGSMRDGCTKWSNQYEETIFNFVDKMEAEELCALMGSCLLTDKLLAKPMPPLSKGAVSAMVPFTKALELKELRQTPGNDNCEACKLVVAEMHSALANPDLQNQVVQYTKAVCDSMGSFADTCKSKVDQYAPMAFGMVLAYLQPDQVCRQLHMCPPPSVAAQMLSSVTRTIFPERFGGALLLHGQPLAQPAAALRLPRA